MIKEIKVTIVGKTPLLMHSAQGLVEELIQSKKFKVKQQEIDYKEVAEKYAYRKKNKELYLPSTAIKGCLIRASLYKKAGKVPLKPVIAGGVRVEPEEIGLGVKKYAIDLRTAVNRGNRVVVSRPRLEKWKASFIIIYDNEMIVPKVIKEVLEDSGRRIGVGSFRPDKGGNFGQFTVSKFQIL